MNNESSMERAIQNMAKIVGFLLLAISIYLSYDGFDQGVTGGNTKYSPLAKLIGAVIAVGISIFQFMFSSRYERLNLTIKGVGLLAYGYSVWTNYLGAIHLLQMDGTTALVTALAMDIVPEPMIAWSMGDSMKGDLLGNIMKWVTGYQPKPEQHQPKQENHPKPEIRPPMNPEALERLRQNGGAMHMKERREGGGQQNQGKKHHNNREKYGR